MTTGEGLLIVGAVGLVGFAFYKTRIAPAAPTGHTGQSGSQSIAEGGIVQFANFFHIPPSVSVPVLNAGVPPAANRTAAVLVDPRLKQTSAPGKSGTDNFISAITFGAF